jgi:chromosome segregation ATPase
MIIGTATPAMLSDATRLLSLLIDLQEPDALKSALSKISADRAEVDARLKVAEDKERAIAAAYAAENDAAKKAEADAARLDRAEAAAQAALSELAIARDALSAKAAALDEQAKQIAAQQGDTERAGADLARREAEFSAKRGAYEALLEKLESTPSVIKD